MGAHAYTYAGGVYFDHRSDTDGSSAIYYEGYMLDDYNGHSNGDPAYQYHYHAVSFFEILSRQKPLATSRNYISFFLLPGVFCLICPFYHLK